ncbi:MAG: hypothetical protein LRY43_01045, partial [Gammaproteobacteria bacterium]|nr:hypothetical protein [Gammaproteobacteria bacterium]
LTPRKRKFDRSNVCFRTLTKVIDEVSTVFPPVDYALLFAHIIDNDGQLDVIIELLTQEAQNILRGILINKQPTEPITREDVRQAVSNNRESAMAVLTNAFDRLVKGDPADIQRKSKITRLIAGATHKTDKSCC